jgi:hypothetical protein
MEILKKDINIIKKDLRAISIKTRFIARELEETKPNNTKKNKPSWLSKLLVKIKSWFGKK